MFMLLHFRPVLNPFMQLTQIVLSVVQLDIYLSPPEHEQVMAIRFVLYFGMKKINSNINQPFRIWWTWHSPNNARSLLGSRRSVGEK